MQNIVLATGNQGKVKEFQRLFAGIQLNIVPQSQFDVPEVPETGTTFVENAIIKARHAARLTQLPAIADDSGLAVTALGGEPGIYSARYAGANASDKDNINALLNKMVAVPAQKRTAQFICALVYMRHADDPTPIICQGEWQGIIASEEIGSDGFGYDPIFWLPEQQKSAAQLSKESKNAISHRGHALRLLLSHLQQQQQHIFHQ